jgi:hypothetical protein
MREIRPSGSEGGVALTAPSLPLSLRAAGRWLKDPHFDRAGALAARSGVRALPQVLLGNTPLRRLLQ